MTELDFATIEKVIGTGGVTALSWYGCYTIGKKFASQIQKELAECHQRHERLEQKYEALIAALIGKARNV